MQRHKEKIVAALLAFFLGEWGVHKFYLNEQEAGKKYLIWCVVGILTSWFLIGLIPLVVLFFKKIIDGANYLLMTDDEFDGFYNRKTWVTKDQLKESIKAERGTNCAMSLVKSEEYNIIDIKFPFERNFVETEKRQKQVFDYDYYPMDIDEFVVCASMDEAFDLIRDDTVDDVEVMYSGWLPAKYDPTHDGKEYHLVGYKNNGKRRFYLYE